MVVIGQLDEDMRGDVVFSGLVFGVACLGHTENLRDLLLCQVVVLSEAPDAFVHENHLAPIIL